MEFDVEPIFMFPLELAEVFLLCPDEPPPLLLFIFDRPDGEPNEDDKLPELWVRYRDERDPRGTFNG
jgi:hypothetical protein